MSYWDFHRAGDKNFLLDEYKGNLTMQTSFSSLWAWISSLHSSVPCLLDSLALDSARPLHKDLSPQNYLSQHKNNKMI